MFKFKWYYFLVMMLPFLFAACDRNDDDEIIEYDDDIWDVIQELPQLSTLEVAVTKAGLVTDLDDDKANLTIFAPVNAAFEALPEGELASWLADPTGKLTTVLQYHAIDGVYTPDLLKKNSSLTTTNGETVKITHSGNQIKVNGTVISEPIYVTNGVIYLISSVLMPPSLSE